MTPTPIERLIAEWRKLANDPMPEGVAAHYQYRQGVMDAYCRCADELEKALPQAPLAQVAERDDNRCGVCAWPLVPEGEAGCWRGNCSQRPVPALRNWYDAARYAREQHPTPPAPHANGTTENES